MRRSVFFICLLFSGVVVGQVRLDQPEVYMGASAGSVVSMVNFYPAVKQDYLTGYNAGVVFRYIADKNVGVQAELNYSQRGWSESSGLFSRQLNYIELPFLTHIYVGDKSRFFFNLGPKISYLFSEDILKNNTVNSTSVQHVTNIQNAFDYGLCAGPGFLFRLKKSVLQLDARVYYGLGDIYSNNKRDFFENSHNMNLSLNLGWLIQVK